MSDPSVPRLPKPEARTRRPLLLCPKRCIAANHELLKVTLLKTVFKHKKYGQSHKISYVYLSNDIETKCDPGPGHKWHGYICSKSQRYMARVQMIDFSQIHFINIIFINKDHVA